jgi:two-component system sensor histidine kinase TctE
MASGLQRRLLLLLLVPLVLLAVLNTWFDFRSADSAALQQDRQLLSMVPLLAGSVVAPGNAPGDPPVLLMAPPMEDFLNSRPGLSSFALVARDGSVLVGDTWLSGMPPATFEPEFSSQEFDGITYRIVSQRVQTVAGELVLRLADGSDPRQQWLRQLWIKVALPNLVLAVAAFFAVNWAVRRALRPLIELKEAVEIRSPRDLSALDARGSPEEVRPLVVSLNRLFDLVNAQAESQRRFVADAAHQLRTPLAGLQAQVEAWAQAVTAKAAEAQPTRSRCASPEQVNKLRKLRHAAHLAAGQPAAGPVACRCPQPCKPQAMQRVDLRELCEVMLETHLDAATAKDMDLGLDTAEARHAMGHDLAAARTAGQPGGQRHPLHTARRHASRMRCGWSAVDGTPPNSPFWRWKTTAPVCHPASARACWSAFIACRHGGRGHRPGAGDCRRDCQGSHHSQLEVLDGRDGPGLRM